MVRASSEILHICTRSLHCFFNPIVKINYTVPTLNMHSRKRAILQHVHINLTQIVSEMDNILHHCALPNNINDNTVIRLLQNDTATYQLVYAGNKLVNAWKETKKEKVRKRKQRELRIRAEKLVKMKRELNRVLWQSHKLNKDGRGELLCWWPLVEEWEEVKREARIQKERQSIPLTVKKEEPSSPKIPIKVEEPPTPQFLYPSQSSRYISLDPNNFDWGKNAMVN